MIVQPSLDLYRIKPDGTPNAEVRNLTLLGQFIDMLASPAGRIRDYGGTNQFRQTTVSMGFVAHCFDFYLPSRPSDKLVTNRRLLI